MDILKDFDLYIENKDLTNQTKKSYKLDIKKFINWYENETTININNLTSLTDFDLKNYLNFLLKSNYSIRSINRYITSLNKFISWLNENHINHLNIIKTIKNQPKINKNILNEHEIKIIEDFLKSLNKTRDLLIINFFLNTQIQAIELCDLKIKNINFNKKIISIYKDNKLSKILSINRKLYNILNLYMEERRKKELFNSPFLILGEKTHDRISRFGIYSILKKYTELTGIEISISILKNTYKIAIK